MSTTLTTMADMNAQIKGRLLQAYEKPEYRPLNIEFEELRRQFRKTVLDDIIVRAPYWSRFFTDDVPNMFVKTVQRGLGRERTQEAFHFMELYCLNLIHYHWKPEISKLKRHTGIYRTKLLDVVPDVDTFINSLGYVLEANDVFVLTSYVSRRHLYHLALDCFIAQAHCDFMDIVALRLTPYDLQWDDVARMMEQLEGEEMKCATLVLNLNFASSTNTTNSLKLLQENVQDIHDADLYA